MIIDRQVCLETQSLSCHFHPSVPFLGLDVLDWPEHWVASMFGDGTMSLIIEYLANEEWVCC
jgi:hypothetical protein